MAAEANLQAPVLCISNNMGNAFRIVLCGDLYRYEFTHHDYLRFSLCYDDAVGLLAAHTAGTIGLVGSNGLQEFVTAVDTLRTALPGVAVGGRRRHALLGRTVIGTGGRQMRFVNGLTIITANQTRLNADPVAITTILNNCTNAVATHIGLPLFNGLEDDYLAEVPRDDEKLES